MGRLSSFRRGGSRRGRRVVPARCGGLRVGAHRDFPDKDATATRPPASTSATGAGERRPSHSVPTVISGTVSEARRSRSAVSACPGSGGSRPHLSPDIAIRGPAPSRGACRASSGTGSPIPERTENLYLDIAGLPGSDRPFPALSWAAHRGAPTLARGDDLPLPRTGPPTWSPSPPSAPKY
jgi:hypothetical protein